MAIFFNKKTKSNDTDGNTIKIFQKCIAINMKV